MHNEVFIRKVAGIGNIVGTRELPGELWVLNPSKMQEVTNSAGDIIAWTYGNQKFTVEEIIHIKDFNPYNENRGLDPREPLGQEMNLDYLASVFNMAFFQNDATPNALITTDKSLSKEQRDRLKQFIENRHKGAENKHKMDILEGGLKMETLTPSHKDMEFIEQRRFSREELLGAWRAPKALFNITENLNYATFEGQMKVFWLYAIMPILRKVEDAINVSLVWPYDRTIYFAFNIKNVPAFQADLADKVGIAKTLIEIGFTANEVNQKLGLGFDTKAWREFWWVNWNYMPSELVIEGGGRTAALADPNAEKIPAKGIKIEEAPKMDIQGWATWKSFLSRQAPTERMMDRKLSRFFGEQRGRILSALHAQNMRQGPDVLNWEHENEILKKYIRPLMTQAVEDGIKHAEQIVGKKSLSNLDVKIPAYVEQRIAQIVGINATTRKLLRKTIDQAIEEGKTITDIQQAVKDQYAINSTRSLRIARTETVGAVNGGSKLYYEDAGIQKKRWLTAGDELVRTSHRMCESEGAIKIDGAFVNGCRYPGDQEVGDPGEVCNCRCTLMPVIE